MLHTACLRLLSCALALAVAPLAAQNPLAKKKAYVGLFTGEDIALQLAAPGDRHEYAGKLTFRGTGYACVADTARDGSLAGQFTSDGTSYPFTATLRGDDLTLVSDGESHALRRQPAPTTEPAKPTPIPAPPPAERPQQGGVGIAFRATAEQEWLVEQIAPNSPAAKAKLEPGGTLRAVDKKAVAGLSLEQVRAMVMGPVGSMVTLTIETKTEVQDVILQRAALQQTAPSPQVAPGEPPTKQPDPTIDGALPAWLRPGARVTLWMGSAQLPGVSSQLVEDDAGNWIDPTSGKRYADQQNAGGGGYGYLQINVVSASRESIAFDTRSHPVLDMQAQRPMIGHYSGFVTPGDTMGDYWTHPAKLAAMAEQDQGGLRVRRVRYPLGGRTYDALTVQVRGAAGYTRHTYDLQTGICIAYSSATQGANVSQIDPGGRVSSGAGVTTLVHSHLLNVRQLELPWAKSPLPRWLRGDLRLDYQGTYQSQIPGATVPPLGCQCELQVTQLGTDFATLQLRSRLTDQAPLPGDNGTARVIGAAQIASLFIAPQSLARLRAEQVLDEDPVTGVRTLFAGSRDGIGCIAEQGAFDRLEYYYDLRNGMLVGWSQNTKSGIATNYTQLRLTGR